jgi:hypothetical protein
MITFANIVDRFETFVESHFFLKSFSFGSPEDLDLDKFENFPLCHLVYTSGSYADKVKSYTLEVYILDCPRGEDSRKEFEKDAITQSELAAEDILADLENGGNIFDFDFAYNLESASVTPLEEMETNVLSGTLLQISIGVPYLYDTCNAPLSGVSPQGTNTTFSARGLLRVKEVDGSPDVTTVKTINVSNGTLTDNGSGVVTIDTGGGGASSLNELTDVDLTSTANNQSLVFNSTSSKFENGNPISTGQETIFKRISPSGSGSTLALSSGSVGSLQFGVFNAGGVTFENNIRAGAAFGMNFTGTVLQMLPVSGGSKISLEVKYEVTLSTPGLVSIQVANPTGQFQTGLPIFQLETQVGTFTRTATGPLEDITLFALSNTVSFQVISTATGSITTKHIKVTVQHG